MLADQAYVVHRMGYEHDLRSLNSYLHDTDHIIPAINTFVSHPPIPLPHHL